MKALKQMTFAELGRELAHLKAIKIRKLSDSERMRYVAVSTELKERVK
jgi:hypothetical protein